MVGPRRVWRSGLGGRSDAPSALLPQYTPSVPCAQLPRPPGTWETPRAVAALRADSPASVPGAPPGSPGKDDPAGGAGCGVTGSGAHCGERLALDDDALADYDVVILSDVGSNSLLFHPQMLAQSVRRPNRLTLLRDWVSAGGGLVMVGGWMSFSGIDGRARYHDTPLEQALPVTCTPWDDRAERPEGVVPDVAAAHPVLDGVPEPWPFFLGYNKVKPREEAEVVLSFGADPLLALWEHGDGRAAAFTSDCAPHWGPPGFLEWEGYPRFWCNLVEWLAKR